uniref:Uncharacterized protein n=1 Tax=Aegilops tauschii subsp. strangulata TaxID=200361 RepID=A0A453ACN7_AEGTS
CGRAMAAPLPPSLKGGLSSSTPISHQSIPPKIDRYEATRDGRLLPFHLFFVSRPPYHAVPRLVDWWRLIVFLRRDSVRAADNRRGTQIQHQQVATPSAGISLSNLVGQITSTSFGPKTSDLGRRIKRGRIGARSFGVLEVPIPTGEQWPAGRGIRGRLGKQADHIG